MQVFAKSRHEHSDRGNREHLPEAKRVEVADFARFLFDRSRNAASREPMERWLATAQGVAKPGVTTDATWMSRGQLAAAAGPLQKRFAGTHRRFVRKRRPFAVRKQVLQISRVLSPTSKADCRPAKARCHPRDGFDSQIFVGCHFFFANSISAAHLLSPLD